MKIDPNKKTRKKDAAKRSLQTYVNKYCRLRDCFGEEGAPCISCGKWTPYDEGDGGHFIPTTSGAIRFDERNINHQCRRCNRFLHGNPRHYYKAMIHKYGQGVVDELESREFEPKKWTIEELDELKKYYKEKIDAINRGEDPRQHDPGLDMSSMFSGLGESREVS
jgi:hypothetical protein